MWSFEVERQFDDLVYRKPIRINSKEVDGCLEFVIEVPGCGSEDVKIFVQGDNCLMINNRFIQISKLYDVTKCTAKVKNGLLTCTIPKKDYQKIPVAGV